MKVLAYDYRTYIYNYTIQRLRYSGKSSQLFGLYPGVDLGRILRGGGGIYMQAHGKIGLKN